MNQIQIQEKRGIWKITDILRNCKARQIRGGLFDGKGGMCALGAIYVGFGLYTEWGDKTPDINFKEMEDAILEYSYSNPKMSIASLNDHERMTFSEIADVIERCVR